MLVVGAFGFKTTNEQLEGLAVALFEGSGLSSNQDS